MRKKALILKQQGDALVSETDYLLNREPEPVCPWEMSLSESLNRCQLQGRCLVAYPDLWPACPGQETKRESHIKKKKKNQVIMELSQCLFQSESFIES